MPTLTQDGENGKWKITTLYHEYSENVAIPVTLYYPTHGENSVSYTISHTKNTEKQTDWATPVGEEIDTDKISFDSNTVLSADGTKKYKITGITWTQEAYRPPTPEPTYTYDVVLGNTGTTAFACNDGVYSPTDISLTATYNTYADGVLVQSASTDVTNSATWSSNNTNVATVNKGNVKYYNKTTAGKTVTITAGYNGYNGTTKIYVPVCDYGEICVCDSTPTDVRVSLSVPTDALSRWVNYTGGTQQCFESLDNYFRVGKKLEWHATKMGYIEQSGSTVIVDGKNCITFNLEPDGDTYEFVSAVLKYIDYDFLANGRASAREEKSCDYILKIIYKKNGVEDDTIDNFSDLKMTATTTNGGTFSNTDFCVGATNRGTTLGNEQTVCEITRYSFTFMDSAFTSDMSSVGFDGGKTKLTFTQEANQETTETEDRNCETKTENSQCVWTISPSTTGTTFTTGNTAFTVDIKSQKTYDEVQYCDKYVKLTSGEWVLKQEGVEKSRETKTTNVDPMFVNSSSANIGVVTGTPTTNYTHRYIITSKKQGQNIDLGTVTFSHPECTDDTKTYTFKDNSIITEIVYPKIDTGTTGVGVHVEDEKSFGIRIPYVFDGTGATPGVTWMYEIINAKFRVKYKNNLGEENEVLDNWPNPIYVTGKTDEFGLGVTNVGLSDGVGESCDNCYQDGNWASQVINVSTESGGETTYLTVRLPDAFTLVTGGSENFPQLTSKKIAQPHKIPD